MATLRRRTFSDWLSRSGSFFAAILLNLILFVLLANYVIYPAYHHPEDDFNKIFVPTTKSAPPPSSTPATETSMPAPSVAAPTTLSKAITSPNSTASFNIPMPSLTPVLPTPDQSKALTSLTSPSAVPPSNNHIQERIASIMGTLSKWGRSTNSVLLNPGDVKSVVATFPICLAYYQNGDPFCNNYQDNKGNIASGALPNLMREINEWSHGNIKGTVDKQAINVGSPDLLAKMPPFIFFTGHTNFTLTDDEVKNLQLYLHNGGAIWGDSALAGTDSRFDVAFRREMKRVIPDIDKNFEPLPKDHKIFNKSWFPMDHIPSGMNYYAEPIQVINLDGQIAVLYTPNDYGDMMTGLLTSGDRGVNLLWYSGRSYNTKDDPYFPLNSTREFYENSGIYYRNYQSDSILDVDKIGMNIVAHLLVRFDEWARLQ